MYEQKGLLWLAHSEMGLRAERARAEVNGAFGAQTHFVDPDEIQKICPQIKCLYMSGYTANVITRDGMLSEDMNFIAKPFSMEGLAAKVREG